MQRAYTYSQLTSEVRTLSDPQINWWNDRFAAHNICPRDVCDILTSGIPGERDNLLERIDVGSNRASLEVKGYDEVGEVFWASRTVQFTSRELNLDVLRIREGYQSQGFGKTLLRNAYRFAKSLGFKRLTLTAMDVGSFAWARAGFFASASSWTDPHCRGRIESYIQKRQADLGPALTADLLRYTRGDDPRALWMLAAYKQSVPLMTRPEVFVPLGVAILFESESSWQGTIELEDGEIRREQIVRVRRYIGLSAGE